MYGPWYAVSVLYESGESAMEIIELPTSQLAVYTSVEHLGDANISSWEVSSPTPTLDIVFELDFAPPGTVVRVDLELFDVDYSGNKIFVNGARAGSLPTQKADEWQKRTVFIPSGLLKEGTNKLEIHSRDSSGSAQGNLDDFQVGTVELTTLVMN